MFSSGACGFDAWRVDVGTSDVASNLVGNTPFGAEATKVGTLFFDSPRDRLLSFGWGGCDSSNDIWDTVEILGIER